MFGLATLDILIGLAVVFLLLSLTCSALIELLAAQFRWRAANLAIAISGLLQDHEESLQAFYAHRRIWTLGPDPNMTWLRSTFQWLKQRLFHSPPTTTSGNARPSYIAADTFSQVLLDLIVPTDAPASQRGRFWLIRQVVLQGPGLVGTIATTRIRLDENKKLAEILVSFVNQATLAADDTASDADVRRLDALNAALRQWYNETMDRAAGWYKQKIRRWIFLIGFFAAIACNIDTLAITQALYTNPEMRQQAVALGQQLSEKSATEPATQSTDEMKLHLKQLGSLGLPLGWTSAPEYSSPALLLKALGILITAVAVSLGAPFWFDILNKLVNIRASGASPAKKESEDKSLVTSASAPALPAATAVTVTSGGTVVTELQVGLPADYWSQEARRLDFTRFAPGATQYDPNNAACLARAAYLAYQNKDTVGRIATTCWGATTCEFVDIDDTQAFVADFGTFVLLSFRGTEPTHLQDILADARFALMPAALSMGSGTSAKSLLLATAGQAHSGFLRALAVGVDVIDKHVARLMTAPNSTGKPKTLWITGHSLGAALATLYATRILCSGAGDRLKGVETVHGLYTFGSPRVGDTAFVTTITNQLATVTYRFINDEDIVTRVAPRMMGYDHVGQTMFLDQNGVLDRSMVGWVRFLNTVIDTMNDFKLAARTSVKDHSMELYVRKLENLTGT